MDNFQSKNEPRTTNKRRVQSEQTEAQASENLDETVPWAVPGNSSRVAGAPGGGGVRAGLPLVAGDSDGHEVDLCIYSAPVFCLKESNSQAGKGTRNVASGRQKPSLAEGLVQSTWRAGALWRLLTRRRPSRGLEGWGAGVWPCLEEPCGGQGGTGSKARERVTGKAACIKQEPVNLDAILSDSHSASERVRITVRGAPGGREARRMSG